MPPAGRIELDPYKIVRITGVEIVLRFQFIWEFAIPNNSICVPEGLNCRSTAFQCRENESNEIFKSRRDD